ncbi:hypothetical protein D9Q98_004477 [Chlorella vulgaris]|uniref:Uncharacterized protein n=1 Tax=Chlorella vulgaris TaxID=3077 RepID=A0A9D4TR13_CHLVU|nr:hypothetical protein D9Q98_004477 [Chlorella vulgaris]
MGNFPSSPGTKEFAEEFRRLQAENAAAEAEPDVLRDAVSLRRLNLQLLDMKIASAKHYQSRAWDYAQKHVQEMEHIGYHCERPSRGVRACCAGAFPAHHQSIAWRRAQEEFYHQLRAMLEQEKSAWSAGRPVPEMFLPPLPEAPEPFASPRVGAGVCSGCIEFITWMNNREPFLRNKHDFHTLHMWLPDSDTETAANIPAVSAEVAAASHRAATQQSAPYNSVLEAAPALGRRMRCDAREE